MHARLQPVHLYFTFKTTIVIELKFSNENLHHKKSIHFSNTCHFFYNFVYYDNYIMSGTTKKSIEVCFSPALINYFDIAAKNVVIIDILRATSTICTAFARGVKEIIPVATVDEALKYKKSGHIVAGEQNGKTLPFADYGNSPLSLMAVELRDKSMIFCTTNGTKAVSAAAQARRLIFGSYLNFSALTAFLEKNNNDIVLLCSGWNNNFSLEDTLFAGALCTKLIIGKKFRLCDDAAMAAMNLWNQAKNNLLCYIKKGTHYKRLIDLGFVDDIKYCHTFDTTDKVPFLQKNAIVCI